MPSIPQSLLWISLVVLWLFVLVPMLINKRDSVRRTSDVALATRVLNSAAGTRLRRRGPAAGHRSDPDWQPSESPDDDVEHDEPGRAVVMVAAERGAADEPDYLDVDVVEEPDALPVGASAGADQAREDDEASDPVEPELPLETVAETEDAADDEYEGEDDADADDEPAAQSDRRIPDAVGAARRRRRESDTAAAVAARKYRFRTRTLTVMAVLLLTSAVAALTWSSSMWWVTTIVGVVAVLYLAYLRRQTRIEEQVRRRRAQRMARSRLGVENTSDREFDVVPSRLRRPGAAVLEIDDEDPEFEHLEYVAFARHYDLPRAAGQ
ncbi:gephyrin-like molybdotransferase receptor GlpR [Mycobacterium sp. pV006]|uniref:divisome protein SepX/GlpR n=1 Tax=Mycobacterium sp. pV006 TaxID=3238983 RepID=UPI00351B2625